MSLFIALTLAAAQSSGGAVIQMQPKDAPPSEIKQAKDPLAEQLDQGLGLIRAGKPAEAIAVLDKVIAAEEGRYRDEKRLIFSARSGRKRSSMRA